MKKLLILTSFILALFFGVGYVYLPSVDAQILCKGSATCKYDCVSTRTPEGCKTTCPPDDPGCRLCTGYRQDCNTQQISCGFDNVWGGSCAADCSSTGGSLDSANCSSTTVTPAPTPVVRYNCNPNGYSCYNAGASGWYSSYSSCSNNCKPAATVPPQPEPDPDPPECNTCGCPGKPPCSCQSEANCGAGAWDCCGNACVPEGSPCCPGGNCCSSISVYDPTNVWVRVVSDEPGIGTVAWKGTADAIVPPPGSTWSGNGLDAQGYFQTYQPYQNRSAETFNKTKNRIDPNMKVTVSTYPQGEFKYTNKCGEPVTNNLDGSPAHGLVWSNHFCAAGWAWEPQTNRSIPAKTKNRSGDDYYTEMSGSGSDLFPEADRDGCWGLFKQPNDAPETVKSYHESLVPLLELASANTSLDLSYAGYWSAAYQAWETYDQTSELDSLITLTPPTNYHCQNVRWWGKQAQDTAEREYSLGVMSMTDGSCRIRFNPKKYDNLLILQVAKNAIDERCTVQVEAPYTAPGVLSSSANVDVREGFKAHVSGETSEVTAPQTEEANLWITKSDYSIIYAPDRANRNNSIDPDAFYIFDGKFKEIYKNNRYYYKHVDPPYEEVGTSQVPYNNCDASSGQPCALSTHVGSFALANLSDIDLIPEGAYNVFCDVAQGGSTSNCSGNPVCSMNNGGVGDACTGFNDCEVDSATPRDHATVTVACVPKCNALCSLQGGSDGCGGQCPAGTQIGTPGPLDITAPTGTLQMSMASPYNYTITWTDQNPDKAEYYDVVTYPQGAFTGPNAIQDAITAYYANDTRVYYKQVTAPASSTTIQARKDANWKITAGVRATNLSCAQTQTAQAFENYDLIESISGSIKGVNGNICSDFGAKTITTNGFPDTQTGTRIVSTAAVGAFPSFTSQTATFGLGNPYGDIVNGNYSVNFLPFSPSTWYNPGLMTTRLYLSNPIDQGAAFERSKTYVCAECNRESLFVCRGTGFNATNPVPANGTNFYVQLFNLANGPWWQLQGGLAYGKTGLHSNPPPTCTGANCTRTIIASIPGSGSNNSAGVPMTSNIQITNDGGFYSANAYGNGGNPKAAATSTSFSPAIENFSYFLVNADVPVPTSVTNGSDVQTIQTRITNADEFKTAFGNRTVTQPTGEIIAWATNHLTINLTAGSANWFVPSGQKWIVFVPGDITFTGPTDHSLAAQRNLIQVQTKNATETGGFLTFIAGGNITFDSSLGYDDPTDLSTYQTPIVEGVFIASNTLIVKKNTGEDPSDYKFVGAGTFAGWKAVNLERDFDDGITRNSFHNTSPTELFIYRPDFMGNSPEFLKKSLIDWKEVN